jgi:hypothetical protein
MHCDAEMLSRDCLPSVLIAGAVAIAGAATVSRH